MFKNIQKYCFFCENKRNNFLKYGFFPLIILILGSFLLANTAWLSSITEENIIKFTNQERKKQGLSPLTANQLLAQAAYEKGRAILDAQTFQHNINGNKFSSWIKKTGYQYNYIGENLAIDFITSEGVIKAWLNSPTHKKNLLNSRFKEIGVAVINGKFEGNDTILVVQEFGAPKFLPDKNIVLNNLDNKPALVPDKKYINNFANAKPLLLNTNNSTKQLFLNESKNYLSKANNNKQNKIYNFYFIKNAALGAIQKISGTIAGLRFASLWLLLIIFFILFSGYLYNNKSIYKTFTSAAKFFKILFKKQKTQLRLPLK